MSEEEKQHVINEINSQIVLGVKAMLITLIPIGLAGLFLLVANHYGQIQLKQQVAEMQATMKITNDRVTIMWMLGGYSEKYKAHKLEDE
jgi:hypothetical protein